MYTKPEIILIQADSETLNPDYLEAVKLSREAATTHQFDPSAAHLPTLGRHTFLIAIEAAKSGESSTTHLALEELREIDPMWRRHRKGAREGKKTSPSE